MDTILGCWKYVNKIIFVLSIQLILSYSQEICPEEGTLCYTIYNGQKSWIDAEQHCLDQGAELASFTNIPRTVLISSGETSLWVRSSSSLASQEFTWLGDTPVFQADIEDLPTGEETSRKCLVMSHSIRGQGWLGTDCEAGHHYLCETGHGRECRLTHLGEEYKGTVSVSARNVTCEYWANQSEALVPDTFQFSDGNKFDAQNYCRNPDSDANGLFCFVPGITPVQFCGQIPTCSNANNPCFESEEGTFEQVAVHCVDGRCYISVDTDVSGAKSWLDAQDCCISFGADLATFDDQEQADAVYLELRPYFALERITYMWVGGYNKPWDSVTATSGNYKIECYAWDQGPVGLQSTPCGEMKSFICEKDKPPTTTTTTTTQASTTPSTIITASSNTNANAASPTSTTTTTSLPSSASESSSAATPSPTPGGNTVGSSTGYMTTSPNGSVKDGDESGEDDGNKLFIYIGVGAGAGLLIIILIIIAIACACCPMKKKEKPFSMYSQEIQPYSNIHARDTYYNNSVFEENELYDNSENISASQYDIPPHAKPLQDNRSVSGAGRSSAGSKRNSKLTSNGAGIANPLYHDERGSIYSQPSKKSKSEKNSKKSKTIEEEETSSPNYTELPDLPPRAYSEIETQTSTYYNY